MFLHEQVVRKRAVWEAEVEEVKVRPGHIMMAHTQTHKHKALHTLPDAVGAISCTLYLYTHTHLVA